MKTELEWTFNEKPITSVNQMPDDVFGFVYLLKYVDGTKYVGKKNVFNCRKIKARKDGETRNGTIERIQKNTGKGYRQVYDVVRNESDWRTYLGSHKECTIRIPREKIILEFANNQKKLTYLEAKYLFKFGVLESPAFLNDNILGSFFRKDLK